VHVPDRFYSAETEHDQKRNGDDHEGDPPPYDDQDRQRDQDRDEGGVALGANGSRLWHIAKHLPGSGVFTREEGSGT
jgi:hypothetical protein